MSHYTQALLNEVTAYLAAPLMEQRQPAGLAELARLWSTITGLPAGSCRQCQFSDFSFSVRAYARQATQYLHPDAMSESQYQITPAFAAEQFVDDHYGHVVTADNLTDAHAEYFMAHGYAHAFVKKPTTGAAEAAVYTRTEQHAADAQAIREQAPQGAMIEGLPDIMDGKPVAGKKAKVAAPAAAAVVDQSPVAKEVAAVNNLLTLSRADLEARYAQDLHHAAPQGLTQGQLVQAIETGTAIA